MIKNKQLTIGLFGFGVVGEGLYKVLKQTPSLKAAIKKICIKDISKKRNAPTALFTSNKNDILFDDEINVIVEVIDDSAAAFEIVRAALHNNKAVVSANKKMIADNLNELLKVQQKTQASFLYESSVCASIPILRNLEEYYDNDLLHSFKAIVNGSTNYILTKIFEDNLTYSNAVLLAQQLGFAESNPTLDTEGYDALNKLIILLAHAYGVVKQPKEILFTGIQNITTSDARIASEKGFDIKLVAQAKKCNNGKIAAFVLPQLIKKTEHLAFVKNEYNGVVIESAFADMQFFYGKGAGSFPTASAVLSDISALRYNYKYEYKKLYHHTPNEITNDYYLKVYIGFYDWKEIPIDSFEWIEEWHVQDERKYLIGVIHVKHLHNKNWWKKNNHSLILASQPIVEDVEVKKLRKRSLELAGIE